MNLELLTHPLHRAVVEGRHTTLHGKCRRGCGAAIRVEVINWGGGYFRSNGTNHPEVEQCKCGKWVTVRGLIARMRPQVKCNAICTGAVGHQCDCSCGGKNHGSDH